MTDERPLTAKQRAFVAEYTGAACGDATEAARRAGYAGNDKTLYEVGRENLAKPAIASALQVYQQAMAELAVENKHRALKTATDMAVWLCDVIDGDIVEKRVEGGKNDFVEYEASAPIKARIDAAKLYMSQQGMMAPVKTELSGTVGVVALTAEQAEALDIWLLVRDDPRVIEVIHERLGGER